MYLQDLAPERTQVETHLRRSKRGRVGRVRRYIREGSARLAPEAPRLTGGLTEEMIRLGLAEGYAARGPWEVERRGRTATLMHYGFPIARAQWNGIAWNLGRTQGRPGYGPSVSDNAGIRTFNHTLTGNSHYMELPKLGKNPDRRLQARGPFGSRVSPYAVVDEDRTAFREAMGIKGASYSSAAPFPKRRGYRVR